MCSSVIFALEAIRDPAAGFRRWSGSHFTTILETTSDGKPFWAA
jgi:hypothetical protein